MKETRHVGLKIENVKCWDEQRRLQRRERPADTRVILSVERNQDVSVERNQDVSVERNQDVSAPSFRDNQPLFPRFLSLRFLYLFKGAAAYWLRGGDKSIEAYFSAHSVEVSPDKSAG